MSFAEASKHAHDLRARSAERNDQTTADLAQVLHDIAAGLEKEMASIKAQLSSLQSSVQNRR